MDVVDIDPLAQQARRRRTVVRIGLPLGGVGLMIGLETLVLKPLEQHLFAWKKEAQP